jgi:predicted transcriptional regulator
MSTAPARHRARRAWADPDDEITCELHLLAGLPLSPIAAVDEAAPLAELRAIFVEQRVPAIAVVDAGHGLRGLVTRTDVLRAAEVPGARAGDVMSGFVFVLPLDATVECAAALMAIEGVGQVVVTNPRGELAGVVSALDIARHVAVVAGYLAA